MHLKIATDNDERQMKASWNSEGELDIHGTNITLTLKLHPQAGRKWGSRVAVEEANGGAVNGHRDIKQLPLRVFFPKPRRPPYS